MKNIKSNEMAYKGMNVFPKSWMIPTPAYKKALYQYDSFTFKRAACYINEAELCKATRYPAKDSPSVRKTL